MKVVEKDIIITLDNDLFTLSGCGSKMILSKKAFNSLARAVLKMIMKLGENRMINMCDEVCRVAYNDKMFTLEVFGLQLFMDKKHFDKLYNLMSRMNEAYEVVAHE